MMKKVAPERHFNMGIAEGNMMAVAAGMAANGKTVFASSFAMFAVGRAYEQIRNSIGYPMMNVKICASHAGITVGEDGASHQTIEDIGLMRMIPGMTVVQPCDGPEAEAAVRAVAAINGPCFVRLGRSAVDIINDHPDYKFELGKANVLRKGSKVALIATGCLVHEALKAYETLKAEGIEVTVVNLHTIKPLDEQCLVELAKTHDVLITCEEHSILTGMGSAVCELLSEKQPVRILRIGQKDVFGESGKPAELLHKYEMDAEAIVKAVKGVL
jgi:transketolase